MKPFDVINKIYHGMQESICNCISPCEKGRQDSCGDGKDNTLKKN